MAVRFLSSENIDGVLTFSTTNTFGNNASITHYTNNYLYIRGGSAGLVVGDNTSATRALFSSSNFITWEINSGAAMHMDSSKRLGIGTSSPNHRLDIYSNENIPLRIHRPSNSNLNSAGAHGIGFSTRSDAVTSTTDTRSGIFSYYNGNLFFATNTSDIAADPDASARMTIINSGYVGIGTMNPSSTLHLKDNFSAGIAITLDRTELSTVDSLFYAGVSTAGSTATDFMFLGTGTTHLSLTGTGNVGIGTATPSSGAKLDVDGSLAIANTGQINLTRTLSTSNLWYGMRYDNDEVQIYTYFASNRSITFNTVSGGTTITSQLMKIESGGNVGINTPSPTNLLDIKSNGNSKGLDIHHSNGNIVAQLIHGGSGDEGQLKLYDSNVETVRISGENNVDSYINSGDVGIGTTNPGAKLNVVSTTTPQFKVEYDADRYVEIHHSAIFNVSGAGQSNDFYIGTRGNSGNNDIVFYTGATTGASAGSERFRIDSSGVVQVRNETPTIQLYNTDTSLGSNQTLGDIDWYQSDASSAGVGVVAKIRGVNNSTFSGVGELAFHTGTASSITERMRIDSNGVLQLTESSASGFLNANGTALELDVNRNPETGAFGDTNKSHARIQLAGDNGGSNIKFNTASANNTVATERMRIDSNGNVGVSYTGPYNQISGGETTLAIADADNAALYLKSNAAGGHNHILFSGTGGGLSFYDKTRGDYNMVIDSSGYIGIRETNPNSYLYVKGTSSVVAGRFWGEAGTVAPLELAQNSGGGFLAKFYSDTFSTVCGSISHSGSATAFNTSSDYRLKENVVEMTGALDRVEQLKPSRFNFIGHEEIVDGFLAHEVSDIVPEAITGTKDEVDAEGNPVYQGIDQSKLVPLLVGAIQELKAEIDTLKSQIQ